MLCHMSLPDRSCQVAVEMAGRSAVMPKKPASQHVELLYLQPTQLLLTV